MLPHFPHVVTAGTGPGQSQEQGTQSGSLEYVAGSQPPEPSPASQGAHWQEVGMGRRAKIESDTW